jgi:hypothetical protein
MREELMSNGNTTQQALSARAEAWDHRPIVQRVVDAIRAGPAAAFQPVDTLSWRGDDEVTIIPSRVVPQQGPPQTVHGRRKRFRAMLTNELADRGWYFVEKKGRSLRFRKRSKAPFQTLPGFGGDKNVL